MTEAGVLLARLTADVRQRLDDRAWYRRQRDLAAGRARTLDGAAVHATAYAALGRENDLILRVLLAHLRAARRAGEAFDGLDEAKRRAELAEHAAAGRLREEAMA